MTLESMGKKRGKRRQEGNFLSFRNFIGNIDMGEVKYRGDLRT